MSDPIERILRQVEIENPDKPEIFKTTAEIGAYMRFRLAQGNFTREARGLIPEPLSYVHPDFEYDGQRREVIREGQAHPLTNIESMIFEALLRKPNEVVVRADLYGLISGQVEVSGDEKVVNVHMVHLRRKLRGENVQADPILTIRGVGYMLMDPTRPKPDELPLR